MELDGGDIQRVQGALATLLDADGEDNCRARREKLVSNVWNNNQFQEWTGFGGPGGAFTVNLSSDSAYIVAWHEKLEEPWVLFHEGSHVLNLDMNYGDGEDDANYWQTICAGYIVPA